MRFLLSPKAILLADQAVYSGTSFALTIALARILSPELFGEYSAMILAVFLGLSINSAWVIQPFQVLVAQVTEARAYASFLFLWQILLALIIGITFYIIGFFIFPQSGSIFPLFLIGFLLHDFGRKYLITTGKFVSALFFDVTTFALMVAVILSITIGHSPISVNGLLVRLLVAYFIPFAALWLVQSPISSDTSSFYKHATAHVKHGKWLFLSAVAQWWSGNILIVASGVYLGTVALGALRLSQSLFGVINILLQAFENYVLPISALKFCESTESGVHYLITTSKKASVIFLPFIAIAFTFPNSIMRIAGGEQYLPYGFIIQGLAILYIFIFVSQPIRFAIRAMLMNQVFLIGYLLSLAFSIVASPLLLQYFNMYGVIGGLIISQIILIIYWLFVLSMKGLTPKTSLWKSYTSY